MSLGMDGVDALLASRRFWVGILVFRVWNALFVRTAFNPDEYWQSTEVAHRMVFGYGHLTWEWQDDAQLRGYAHPMLFAIFYRVLQVVGMDTRWAIAYGPRLLQACLAGLNDLYVYKLAYVYFDRRTASWTVFCQIFSWFTFYVMVRPFSNSIETVCTTAALAHWPWTSLYPGKKADDAVSNVESMDTRRAKALSWAALGVLFRPTSAIMWVYLGITHLIRSADRLRLVTSFVLPIAGITLVTMTVIDRVGYGVWTFVPLNFLKFNVIEGKDKIYGVHPWGWYFFEGFPAIVGTFLPLWIAGWLTAPRSKRELGHVIVWTLLVYSWSAHKEFRFVLPLLPPTLVYAGYCLRNLHQGLYTRLSQYRQLALLRLAIFLICIPNAIVAVYLSRWHQRAPVEVMDFLASNIGDSPDLSVHFWTPCHATPYYSFIHQNVSLWFPDCSPQNREKPEGCESHQLEQNPVEFVTRKYRFPESSSSTMDNAPPPKFDREPLPSAIVLYSSLAARMYPLLSDAEYIEIGSFFHSHVSGDAEESDGEAAILVFRKI